MRRKKKSFINSIIIAAFATLLVFLPGLINAGDLEPPGPPTTGTMKTLDQIPPTWSQKLSASDRFELVLDGEAVLDKETGLVWEKSPINIQSVWSLAHSQCYAREVANRKGWRLPTIEELASLVDNDNSNPALPTGHPFSNVQSSHYWSSTSYMEVANYAWVVDFDQDAAYVEDKTTDNYLWCVRGGH